MEENYRVVTSVEEFSACIEKLRINNIIWFRGQSNSEYPIEPTLFRKRHVIGDYKGIDRQQYNFKKSDAIMKNDLYALDLFKQKHFAKYRISTLNDIDYLYLMQHYDIQTRLLDFSTDPFVALYFSTQKKKNEKKFEEEIENIYKEEARNNDSSTIFCINPYILNKQSMGYDGIINLKDTNFNDLKEILHPLAIETDFEDDRITAQKSKFIFFGRMYNDYEFYSILKGSYFRIIIPNSCRKQIFEHIKKTGYNHTDIFPDFKGIALEINEAIEENYITSLKKLTND